MNKRLDNAIDAARRTLSDDAQEELATLVADYVLHQSPDPSDLLTPEQMTDLERRLASDEPPADPARVRAIFERHGIKADF